MSPLERATRWFNDGWNQRNEDLLRELLHPDISGHVEGGFIRGRESFLALLYRPFISAIPDLQLTPAHAFGDEQDLCIRWRATGTHLGDGLGFPPTGVKVAFRGITWQRYQDGLMIEGEDGWNQSGLFLALQSRCSQGSVSVL